MDKCETCKHKMEYDYWTGLYVDGCLDYAMGNDVPDCDRYIYKNWKEAEEDEYMPSATRGDYSPSCPWNAPGMSISDFI